MNEERLAELMVKVVDGVASPAEREELMDYTTGQPELRQELEAQMAIKAVTDGWGDRLQSDLLRSQVIEGPVSRAGHTLGWSLLLFGVATITGWGAAELMFVDPEVPALVRLGVALLCGGTLFLFLSALRDRLAVHDPYDQVKR